MERDARGSLPPTLDRVTAAIVALSVFVAVAGLAWLAIGRDDPSLHGGSVEAPPPEPASAFSLWLSATRVPPGAAEVVAMLVSDGTAEATFGVAATIERWHAGTWVPRGHLVMCMDHWHCTARVQEGGSDVPAIGLSARPGSPGPIERFSTDGLDVGWYRISQEANEGDVAAAILEVADGAPFPAPLVDVDAPAISVSPGLLTPDGGAVSLFPLIPAGPDGRLSREDIEGAIEGLARSAAIERWSGSSWEAVGEVVLIDDGELDLGVSSEMPPLPLGAYRLVRDGPDQPHVGSFWVVHPS